MECGSHVLGQGGHRCLAQEERKGPAHAPTPAEEVPAEIGELSFPGEVLASCPARWAAGRDVVLDVRDGDRWQRGVQLVEPLHAGVVGERHVAAEYGVGSGPRAVASTGATEVGSYRAVSFDGGGEGHT